MIPLRDLSRHTVSFPVVTVAIIAVNLAVFALELSLGDEFVTRWAVVPADIAAGRHWITILTSMFLHGGWLHVLGNMLFLWVFGPAIEDAMGGRRYLGFYLLGGLVASLAQVAVAPTSTIPNLGASGAIAAVMGAFFITYPQDEIRTVLSFGLFFTVTKVRAIVMVGLWFLVQAISASGVLATTHAQEGGVAYMAHVCGFLFGAITGRLFEDPRRIAAQGVTDTSS